MQANRTKRAPSEEKNITEADFQKQVISVAKLNGWRVAHFKTARMQSGAWATPVQGDGKGFPDLVLCREKIVFAELKREKGTLRPDQTVWLDLLTSAGAEVYVWRPSDFEAIADRLSRKVAA